MPSPAPNNGLHKTIHLRHLFTLGVGTIVGVAWLIVLGAILTDAGPVGAMIALTIGAMIMIPIGLCYAELAGILPAAGGEVVYTNEIFGVNAAFITGISLCFIYIINCIFFGVSVGWLVNKLVPGVEGPVWYSIIGTDVHRGDILIAIFCTLMISIFNYRGARSTTRFQDIATYSLLGASFIFITAGIFGGSVNNLKPMIVETQSSWGLGGIFNVIAITPYFFAFNTIPQAIGEMHETSDKRKIALVLTGCILISLLFYCLVLLAVGMVMPRAQLLAFDFPVPEAFFVAFGSRLLGDIVLFAGLVGLLATWNALFYAVTRVLYALGHARIIHPFFGKLDAESGSPVNAVVFVSVIGVFGIFLGKGVLMPVVNVTSTLLAFMYLVVTFGVLRFRQTKSYLRRLYKVPGGLVVIGIAILMSFYIFVLSLYQQFANSGSRIPTEIYILVCMLVFAGVIWMLSRKYAAAIGQHERSALFLHDAAEEQLRN